MPHRGAGPASQGSRRRLTWLPGALRRAPLRPLAAGVVILLTATAIVLLGRHAGGRPADQDPPAGTRAHAAGAGAARSGPLDPGRFSPGACIAFQPTGRNRHRTVFLDAGHGGPDPGGVGTTGKGVAISEASPNLAIELDAAAMLRALGFRVVVSRTRETAVPRFSRRDLSGGLLTERGVRTDVGARDVCANLAHADILLGIYLNAGVPGGAGSVSLYDAARPFAAGNLRLATLVQRDVLAVMNARGWDIPDGGVHPDTGFGSVLSAADQSYGHLLLLGPARAGYFATPSRMPGALIEPLFITDPFEASIAGSASGQHVIAAGIVRAVDQYFADVIAAPTRGIRDLRP